MKYRGIVIFLLLCQQNTIQTKSSVANYIKSFFGSEEPSQKIIHKEYKEVETINITHTSGDIIIQTWKQKSVALEIVHEGSEEFIEKSHVSVQQFDQALNITNDLKSKSSNYTDLHIIIPETTAVTINLENGDINISQSNGNLDLYTEQGDIQINQGENSLAAKTSKGNITLYREKNNHGAKIALTAEKGNLFLYTTETSNLDISAQTLKGKVTSTIPLTLHPITIELNSKNISELERNVSGFIGKALFKTELFCYTGNIQIEPYI
jgi:DUF4097 and DUF4098 domain-containing protein YvlB